MVFTNQRESHRWKQLNADLQYHTDKLSKIQQGHSLPSAEIPKSARPLLLFLLSTEIICSRRHDFTRSYRLLRRQILSDCDLFPIDAPLPLGFLILEVRAQPCCSILIPFRLFGGTYRQGFFRLILSREFRL